MHKTRLTQNSKAKHKYCKNKNKKWRERKSDRITWSFFPSTPWKNISIYKTLDSAVRGKN